MCMSRGGGGGGDGGAAEMRAREEARQSRIRDGMSRINSTFSRFDDAFFDTRRKAAEDYYMPQLEDQWRKAQDDLTFTLARGSNLNNSVAGDRMADARRQYDRARQDIISQALGYATQARGDVERNRSDLVSQLNSSADPEAAAMGAAARAKSLEGMPTFSALGPLFQNITAGLAAATQGAALAGNDAGGGIGLFGRGRGTSRVVT